MKKAPKTSPAERDALERMARNGGVLHRHPDGSWRVYSFNETDPRRFIDYTFETSWVVVNALERRGLVERAGVSPIAYQDARRLTAAGRALVEDGPNVVRIGGAR